MTEDTDHVLAKAHGDRESFAALYDRWSRRVYVYLLGRLGRREDAEDALQATFVTAWRSLPRLRRPERFGPWLVRIARSRAADLVRGAGPRAVPLDGEPAAGEATSDDPRLARLGELVRKLRPETRSLVFLRAVTELTTEETARFLGLGASTVRRRYAHALAHLAERLEGRDGHE